MSSARGVAFQQVAVFTAVPFKGNPPSRREPSRIARELTSIAGSLWR